MQGALELPQESKRESDTSVFCMGTNQNYSAPSQMRNRSLTAAAQRCRRRESDDFSPQRKKVAQVVPKIRQI